MSKGKNKALKRRQMRKVLKTSLIGGHTKMLGAYTRFGYGDGRPGRVREEGEIETWEAEAAANIDADEFDAFDDYLFHDDFYDDDDFDEKYNNFDDWEYEDP